MKNELSEQQAEEIIKILDNLIHLGGWNSSTFLRVIAKKLQNIRDDFAAKAAVYSDQSKISSHLANRVAMRSGQQEVFVSLYTSDGNNLQAWERIIANLPRQMVSRPIYADEADINQAIRAKENKINEAYLSLYIDQMDIVSLGDKTPVDKLGKPLLTLKDRSIKLENVIRFVHVSGIYFYSNGQLIKENK